MEGNGLLGNTVAYITHTQQGINTESSTYTTVSADHMGRGPGIPSQAKTKSDAEAIKENKNISFKREEEEEQHRQSVLFARYVVQSGVCQLISDGKTCEDLVSTLQENAGIDDRTLSRATQKVTQP